MNLDELCEEYLIAKEASTRKDVLSKAIKSLINRKGVTHSERYIVTITERAPKYTVDTELLKKQFPDVYQQVCTKLMPGTFILSNVEELDDDDEWDSDMML